MFEISNDLGKIQFSKNIIYRICADAVYAAGDARIQNYKGRYTTKKPGLLNAFSQGDDDFDDIVIEEAAEALRITVPIVVRFGVSISAVANAIIDHIYGETEYVLGIKPAFVKVVVTGTASKTIARRNIEFTR